MKRVKEDFISFQIFFDHAEIKNVFHHLKIIVNLINNFNRKVSPFTANFECLGSNLSKLTIQVAANRVRINGFAQLIDTISKISRRRT